MPAQLKPAQTTQSILLATSQRPLHLLPRDELGPQPVSNNSTWDSPTWHFDNTTKGAKKGQSAIYWDLDLPDCTNLLDPINADLLDWLKRLVWSLFAAPGDGAGVLKTGSMGSIASGLRWIVSRLVSHHVRWPHEIDAGVINTLIRELRAEAEDSDEGDPETLTESVARSRLKPLSSIWQQRFALGRAGIQPMTERPFGRRTVHSIAKTIGAAAIGQYQPLPDEVAIPVLNKAFKMLNEPAQDVMALHAVCVEAYDTLPETPHFNGDGSSKITRQKRQRKAAKAFRFTALHGAQAPWHPSLIAYRRSHGVEVMVRLRQLVIHIRTAAAMVIQMTTGMRISETCGLRAGINDETGLPTDVRIERSLSGLEEIFVLESPKSKMEETPRRVPWMLGSRALGSTHLPPAIHAMLTLNHLLKPYRMLLGSDHLLVSFTAGPGLPKTTAGVAPLSSDRLRDHMKDFIAEWVDLSSLPDESQRKVADNDLAEYRETQGRCIKTHQLRKLFANFTLRVDPRLIGPLQMQFHHISQAMTDGGYRMSNPVQLREIDDVRQQQSARLMLELIQNPDQHLAGFHGEQIEARIRKELQPRVDNLSTKDKFIEIVSWADDHNLHWYFEPHAICGAVAASEMACHVEAGTDQVARWRPELYPNYAERNPTMCAGCRSVVMSDQHLPFWENRFTETMASVVHYERSGLAQPHDEGPLKLERNRANQARAICRKLGADMTRLDQAVEVRVEEMCGGH